jgi:putative peptidoglycan lipid II flippase
MTSTKLVEYLKKYWPALALIAMAVVSKFIGFLKNAFIAYYFGATGQADLFGILIWPTEFITAYLMNQTIITAITIYFSKIETDRGGVFWKTFYFYRTFLTIAAMVLAVIMAFSYPQVPWYICLFAAMPGILYGMAGIMQGYLNYNRVFFWPGAQELVASIVLTFGVALASKYGIWAYAYVQIFVGLVRVLIQLPDLRKFMKGKNVLRELFAMPKITMEWGLFKYVGPIIFTFILSGVPSFLMLRLLSTTGEGHIAANNYASKIINMFNPIIVIPFTTYLIPTLQRWLKEGRSIAKVNTLALTLIGTASLAFALLLAFAPTVLVKLIYARGAFESSALYLTSQYLKFQAFATVGYAIMYYLLQLSLLKEQSKRLMLSFTLGTIAIIALLFLLPFAPYVTIGVALTVGVFISVGVLVI